MLSPLFFLILPIWITDCKENYCPGDEIQLIPSHSPNSKWAGWQCRRHSMSYKGDLTTLKSIDFQAIENANKTILRIHLTNRQITDIPLSIFKPLQGLKQLDLHLNTTRLTSHIFDTLTNLEHLSIYSYQEDIPQNIFSHLANLKYLKLHIRPRKSRLKPHQLQCKEFEIPRYEERLVHDIITSQLFRPLKQLQYLSISCQCQSIPGNMLQYQSKLNTFILKANISTIPNNLFNGMYELLTLQIKSRNQHIMLSQRLFYHLRSLQTLYVYITIIYNIKSYISETSMLNHCIYRHESFNIPTISICYHLMADWKILIQICFNH